MMVEKIPDVTKASRDSIIWKLLEAGDYITHNGIIYRVVQVYEDELDDFTKRIAVKYGIKFDNIEQVEQELQRKVQEKYGKEYFIHIMLTSSIDYDALVYAVVAEKVKKE